MKKRTGKYTFPFLLLMLFAPLFMGCDNSNKRSLHSFSVDSGIFMLDSNIFTVASAEAGYYRMPAEYWDNRLKQLKILGVNTIMVRVPWMLHEPKEGLFDFTGQNDVREFCRLAKENNLLVWLHVGPYTDAHADMGGLPWWLLNYKDMPLRTTDSRFMSKVGRYFRALAAELADMQFNSGGPITFIQIEEPVALTGNVRGYLSALCDSVRAAGFNDVNLTLAAESRDVLRLPRGIASIAIAVDEGRHAMSNFSSIRKLEHNAPTLCYDISRRCMHVWGEETQKRNLNNNFLRLFEVFEAQGSVNISVAIGGTSFSHIAGAAIEGGRFRPYATSYDNGALINEAGHSLANEHYMRYNRAFQMSASPFGEKPSQLKAVSLTALPEVKACEVSTLKGNLPEPLISERPLTFEDCKMGYGAMLYAAHLPLLNEGTLLRITGLHDNARVYVNDTFVGEISRIDGDSTLVLPSVSKDDKLQILVDALGRVGNIPHYKDYKGITGSVELIASDGTVQTLSQWENIPLPAEYEFAATREYSALQDTNSPGFYRFLFNKPNEGDSFLIMENWGRGEVWINGHSLGRFWNRGPQQSLYLPGCWLKESNNELIILDWIGPSLPVIEGLKMGVL